MFCCGRVGTAVLEVSLVQTTAAAYFDKRECNTEVEELCDSAEF